MAAGVTWVRTVSGDVGTAVTPCPVGMNAGPDIVCRYTGDIGQFAVAEVWAADHLVVDPAVAEAGWPGVADVILDPAAPSEVFQRYSACGVAVMAQPGGALTARCRGGRTVGFAPRRRGCPRSYEEMVACASFAHLWLASGCGPPVRDCTLLLSIFGPGDVIRAEWGEEIPASAGEHGPRRSAAHLQR